MAAKLVVEQTNSFAAKLDEIEAYLLEAGANRRFDEIVDELLDTVIPNLQRFPELGRPFLGHPIKSVEARNGIEALKRKAGHYNKDAEVREYVLSDYVLLYLLAGDRIYLLSIRHHRQLSFDFHSLWPAPRS